MPSVVFKGHIQKLVLWYDYSKRVPDTFTIPGIPGICDVPTTGTANPETSNRIATSCNAFNPVAVQNITDALPSVNAARMNCQSSF